tara:strand:+ start:105 stop:449 length:345 start_codon:yes stop_codon:yes gene_type:complete
MDQLGAFLPLILIFAVFYILLIRPQQKKIKLHREMIDNLKRGDKIITSGGIIGLILKVKDNKEIVVEISDGVEIQLAPGMITELYSKSNDNQKIVKNDNKNENKGFLSNFKKKN